MIDLHSHILPGLDDGARDLRTALSMAEIAVEDGTRVMACTPHINPGVFDLETESIRPVFEMFREELAKADIPLDLVMGADIHAVPGIIDGLQAGTHPTLAGSRYFLFEPAHHICPPNLDKLVKRLVAGGWVPVLTHPERLTWIERNYDMVLRLRSLGALIQITAAAMTGRFGDRALYWSDRLMAEQQVDLIASDAHSRTNRPPGLSTARALVSNAYGPDLARYLTEQVPEAIMTNTALPPRPEVARAEPDGDADGTSERGGWFRSLWRS